MHLPAKKLFASKRPLAAVAATSALMLALTACGGGSSGGGSASGGSGSSTSHETVTVGYQKGALGSFIVSIANEEGYFKDLGLTVNLVTGNSTSAGIDGLKGGSYQFYEGGPESLIPNATSNAGLSILCATGNSSAFDIISGPKYPTIQSLKGQTFAVSSTSSISTVAAQAAFVAQGLSQDAVKPVVVGSTSTRYAALKAGQVAATTLSEPLISQARKDGFHILGYTDVDLGAPKMVTGTITADSAWVAKNKTATVKLLQGVERAVADLYDPSKRDKIAQILATGLDVDLAQAKSALQETYTAKYEKNTQPKDCHVDMAALLNAAKAEQQVGSLKSGVDLQSLVNKSVDGSYAKQAFKNLGGK